MNGTTKNQNIVDPSQTVPIAKIFFWTTQTQALGYVCTRLSILALYCRIFIGRKVRWATFAMIVFVIAQWISYAIAGLFICWPVKYAWLWVEDNDAGHHCGNFNTFYRATTPPNIASDIVLMAIPMPVIWSLRTSSARKIGLSIIFFTTIM